MRRVTSRRYPEATVVDTYCLGEWAHFMELIGQLPDGARTLVNLDISPEDTFYISPSDEVYDLTDEQVNQLVSNPALSSGIWKWEMRLARATSARSALSGFSHP